MSTRTGLPPAPAEVADGVFYVPATETNSILVTEGTAVTVVDAGYPKDLARLEASLARIGRRVPDVAAVVVTHAHMDHIGDSARWRREHGTRVLVWEPEVPLARGDIRQMISRPRVLSHLFEPGTARALLRVLGALRLHHIVFWEGEPVPDPEPFDGTVPLDVPGGLVPVPTPGHTSGHCSYHLPGRGVLISGDALVTEDFPRRTHPPEPQLMHPDFAHDYARALESVQRLRDIAADVIIPGHGLPYHGSPASAVTHALERARAQPAQRR